MVDRSFKVVKVNGKTPKKTGRYLCSNASGAGKKAFNELLRQKKSKKSKSKSKSKKKSGNVKMTITLQETTENSKKKEYTYKIKRVVLKSPRVVELKDGTRIVYKYDTKVESV
jgi:hypothetical protein